MYDYFLLLWLQSNQDVVTDLKPNNSLPVTSIGVVQDGKYLIRSFITDQYRHGGV